MPSLQGHLFPAILRTIELLSSPFSPLSFPSLPPHLCFGLSCDSLIRKLTIGNTLLLILCHLCQNVSNVCSLRTGIISHPSSYIRELVQHLELCIYVPNKHLEIIRVCAARYSWHRSHVRWTYRYKIPNFRASNETRMRNIFVLRLIS